MKKFLLLISFCILCSSVLGQNTINSNGLNGIYYLIQISAYSNKSDAVNKSGEIKGSYVDNIMNDGQEFYMVRFGKFSSIDEARIERDKIRSLGENPVIIKVDSTQLNEFSKPKFSIGQDFYQVTGGDAGQPVFRYNAVLAMKCNKPTYQRVSRIVSADPQHVYFVCEGCGGNTIECIGKKDELDAEVDRMKQNQSDDVNAYNNKIAQSKSSIKNRIDAVAQVLNYSSGCKDDGCDRYTWAVKDARKCVYEKVDLASGSNTNAEQISNLINMFSQIDSPTFGTGANSVNVINLNDLDPKSIKIVTMDHTTTQQKEIHDPKNYLNIIGYNNIQNKFQTQDVQYMGKPLFSEQNLDINRLNRGWSLIYSKYCSGTKKAF